MSEDDNLNPYATPTTVTVADTGFPANPVGSPEPRKVVTKWLMVCCVAAGPSFFFGGGIGQWRTPAVLGMIAGVLVFVAGYSLIEFTPQVQSAMSQRIKRRASRIAYMTRMGISILFPFGVFIDMYCGIVSVGLANYVTGGGLGEFGNSVKETTLIGEFLAFLLTTIVQGILLNIILFAYMLVVYGFLCVVQGTKQTKDALSPDECA